MTGFRRRVPMLVVCGLVAAACAPPETAPATTSTLAAQSTTTIVAEVEGVAYELLALASHPNGAQLRIDRIEVLSSSTVVSGHIINGSSFEVRLGNGQTTLATAEGETIPLLDPLPLFRIPPAEEAALIFRFGPLPQTASVALRLNQGGGSSPSDPTATAPSFEIGPLALDGAAGRPQLPDPVSVARTAVDVARTELRVEGINFTETRIGVQVRISNPTNLEARIAPTFAPTLLVDDLGHRYPLVLPEGQGFLAVPAAGAVAGTLVFAGRIHPDATSLGLGVNTGSRSAADRDRFFPEFVVRDILLSGDASLLPLPESLPSGDSASHPAGVVVEIGAITFTESGTQVVIRVANERSDTIALAATTPYAEDDAGHRYPLVALAGNPNLVVGANTTVEATLGFSGRISEAATSISLVFNADESASDPASRRPRFAFGPYALQRPDRPPEPLVAQVFPVGDRTRLVAAEFAVSRVDQITQTLQEFGATEVDGGFRLTLPDSILFDFGSAELRADALHALTLLAEVLDYYSDAEVIVVGHTDSVGSAAANQRLSEQRARSVVDALINSHGITASRLTAEGRGATEPVAPNTNPDGSDNPEGRQLNRRVEIVVLTDQPIDLGP